MKMVIVIEILIIFFSIIIKKIFLIKKLKINNKIKLYKKGKYLSILANCVSCHTPHGGKPYSGGVPLKTKFGVIFTPNITPDKSRGIGNLKLNEFKKIMKEGISKENKFLYPIFPYLNYSKLKNIDINSIYLFLKSLPKEKIKNIKNKINFPINYRNLLIGWRILFFKNLKENYKKIKSSIKRGKYIINSLGHCNMCHGMTNNFESNINKLKYVGNNINIIKWYAPPLINNVKEGINNKSIQEISNIINYGKSKNKTILGPMAEIINNSLQNINKIDIKSISTFLKILFNKNFKVLKILLEKNFNKINSKFSFDKGKIIYKNNCMSCHGLLTLGNFPNYSNLSKTIINDKFKESINNVLYYTNNVNTYKNKFSSIMKNFLNFIKNKDTLHIKNYLLFINKLKK